ncbi:hypothetical protein G7B40_016625 [Aetokthonos hydrillicola Thurmond2011]|jgi:hypothetical protein|uniref:Type I restriction enzyme R protein N-terminal domain-containing protein n=2 Tax=Aetokthonos TaxID=1550243 RepID=A0AAP5I7K0_9CYAN|nr:hypothetical protein [Aetokthonos hydrillicola]MBO3458803.1 hypothetical protein [Aetokthonos hydrillicola CCALA 1050]MBW4585550.1 hypothetical protein [Aetokthonos hydrillicola CCALA 1050]MDR9896174.1 hypothetical protein [Aetokthonos hydrillicola Thurmond2011]
MPFSSYKSISAVSKEFQIKYVRDDFIVEIEFPISDVFREELDLIFNEGVFDNSEIAVCENIIYPVLKEVWKHYRRNFLVWSHQTLIYDEKLCGIPDYILAKRSPLGTVVFDKPYFVLVEAKKESDFTEGWGQCFAEMVAVQRLNNQPEQIIFGIVSNGAIWQFSKLNLDVFTQNKTFYTIQELERLFAAVNYVFQQCQLQLEL